MTIETILITSTMSDLDMYFSFINGRKLNRKFFVYQDVKYQVILGQDILELIKHKHFLMKQRNMKIYKERQQNRLHI